MLCKACAEDWVTDNLLLLPELAKLMQAGELDGHIESYKLDDLEAQMRHLPDAEVGDWCLRHYLRHHARLYAMAQRAAGDASRAT